MKTVAHCRRVTPSVLRPANPKGGDANQSDAMVHAPLTVLQSPVEGYITVLVARVATVSMMIQTRCELTAKNRTCLYAPKYIFANSSTESDDSTFHCNLEYHRMCIRVGISTTSSVSFYFHNCLLCFLSLNCQ